MKQAQELSRQLKDATKGQSFFMRFKSTYRPVICPFDELLPLVPEGSSVLDIGCGSGAFLYLVGKFRHPKTLCGLDINDKTLEEARILLNSSGFEGRLKLKNIEKSCLAEEVASVNFVSLIDVIHHVPVEKQRELVTDLCQSAKKGTKILIKDIDKSDRLRQIFNKLHDLVLAREWVNETTPEILKSWFGSEITILEFRKTVRGPYAHFWYLIQT
jgi:2-polyprenyl-3-methyl-5-hydroxy-6-metoxy-1,4-benzoquinol methylase